VALGTVTAASAAVYFGGVRQFRRRPALSLDYVPRNPEDAQVVGIYAQDSDGGWYQQTQGAYVRFEVSNAPGKDTAENVEVMIDHAGVDRPDGSFHHARLGGFPLAWANTWSATEGATTRLSVPPGVSRRVDLVSVREDEKKLTMEVDPRPADFRHQLPEGTTTLRLVLTAHNADARYYVLRVTYDGEWEPDIWSHLDVEVPQLADDPLPGLSRFRHPLRAFRDRLGT
jgi:hypothetical protein